MEVKFHAERELGGKEFVCNRCSNVVERMPGKTKSDELPFVMYCPGCDSVCAQWASISEREDFLKQMPTA
jgi:hypothetical protein